MSSFKNLWIEFTMFSTRIVKNQNKLIEKDRNEMMSYIKYNATII